MDHTHFGGKERVSYMLTNIAFFPKDCKSSGKKIRLIFR